MNNWICHEANITACAERELDSGQGTRKPKTPKTQGDTPVELSSVSCSPSYTRKQVGKFYVALCFYIFKKPKTAL